MTPFDSFGNQPTPLYDSLSDHEERKRVRAALRDLLAALDEPRRVGIGHNNPPETIAEAETAENIKSDAKALQTEFEKPQPSISLVNKLGTSLYNTMLLSAPWIGRKADLAVDTSIKIAVPIVAATYSEPLHKLVDSLVSWLSIVAHKIL